MKEKITYIACDGREFESKVACEAHEKALNSLPDPRRKYIYFLGTMEDFDHICSGRFQMLNLKWDNSSLLSLPHDEYRSKFHEAYIIYVDSNEGLQYLYENFSDTSDTPKFLGASIYIMPEGWAPLNEYLAIQKVKFEKLKNEIENWEDFNRYKENI